MASRIISDEHDRAAALTWLGGLSLPMTLNVTKGKDRSIDQNRLSWMLYKEIAEQFPDQAQEWWRGYCKLSLGVPILRADNEAFRAEYDDLIRPMSFEDKIRLMTAPLDWAVTRLMTTKQMWQYLESIYQHFTEKGAQLTVPQSEKP